MDAEIMLSELLKTTRKARGMSQQKAAKAMGIGESTLWHYEKATRPPAVRHVPRLAEFLEIAPRDLIAIIERGGGNSGADIRKHDPQG